MYVVFEIVNICKHIKVYLSETLSPLYGKRNASKVSWLKSDSNPSVLIVFRWQTKYLVLIYQVFSIDL